MIFAALFIIETIFFAEANPTLLVLLVVTADTHWDCHAVINLRSHAIASRVGSVAGNNITPTDSPFVVITTLAPQIFQIRLIALFSFGRFGESVHG